MALKRISHREIMDVVNILPLAIGNYVFHVISADDTRVVDRVHGDIIRATYFAETGGIEIHGFTDSEILNFDYVDIILHEIAHKIFDELMCRKMRLSWAEARKSEYFPIELNDLYVLETVWEEEFSIVFSLVYLERFFWRRGMSEPANKVQKVLNMVPKRTVAVRSIVRAAEQQLDDNDVHGKKSCGQRLHRRVMEFVFGKGGHVVEKKDNI